MMELHTLGVNGRYTQTDVAELSRVLTGWTIDGEGKFHLQPGDPRLGREDGARRDDSRRLAGARPAGIKEGEQMLELPRRASEHGDVHRDEDAQVAAHRETRANAQIATIASVYRATGGDIKAMIRAILNDAWLPTAPMKFKRPFHYPRVRRLRSTNPTVDHDDASFNGQLNNLGQQLFAWETPDGYPDKIEYWSGNIVPRWSYGVSLVGSERRVGRQVRHGSVSAPARPPPRST